MRLGSSTAPILKVCVNISAQWLIAHALRKSKSDVVDLVWGTSVLSASERNELGSPISNLQRFPEPLEQV
ncbi:MAG: hypothetical protein WAT96_10060 [Streptococcus suis]